MDEREKQLEFIDKCRELVRDLSRQKGRSLSFCVTTFGCQMNARDSEKLCGILESIGYVSADEEEADLIIFNTCTVRDNANQRVYGHLGRLKSIKKERPDLMVGICGCMMQEESAVRKVRESYSFVDIIFGTHNVYALAEILYDRLTRQEPVVQVLPETDKIVEQLPVDRKYSFKSGVNISFGCNNFCTYCIVPYVRGRERSRKASDILGEVQALAKDGVVEVMLLGQNVNSYGNDLKDETEEEKVAFPRLLQMVTQVPGIERVRFMTSHPKDLSDELIDVIAGNEKICRHFHLPLQSGSSRLLKDMNRRYDKEHYLDLVKKLRERVPDIAITTDIIVGYPGETDEDNEETLDVIRQAEFDNAFTFQYSKRTGTPAAARADQVPPQLVKERFDKVLSLVQEMSAKRSLSYVGKVMDALVEEENLKTPGYVTGRLSTNSSVHFKGGSELIGKLVKVRLTESRGFYFMGEMV